MRATVLDDGTAVRWTGLPGRGTRTVYVHGLGAASVPHFLHVASHEHLAGRPATFVDLPGFGWSDRPSSFDYSLAGHARAVAAVIDDLGEGAIDVVGHSLGGSVALVLAHERPDLVARLVVVEPNLLPWDGTASVAIARQDEDDFVARGMARLVREADPAWAATLRLADPIAVHRTSVGLCVGSDPTMATILATAPMPRALVWGELTPRPAVLDDLLTGGVALRIVPGSGHVPMFDAPDAFADALADLLPPGMDPTGGGLAP